MNTQLGWTTIEQSKKLIEAGLDIKIADMFYRYDYNTHKHYVVPDTILVYNWDDYYKKKYSLLEPRSIDWIVSVTNDFSTHRLFMGMHIISKWNSYSRKRRHVN